MGMNKRKLFMLGLVLVVGGIVVASPFALNSWSKYKEAQAAPKFSSLKYVSIIKKAKCAGNCDVYKYESAGTTNEATLLLDIVEDLKDQGLAVEVTCRNGSVNSYVFNKPSEILDSSIKTHFDVTPPVQPNPVPGSPIGCDNQVGVFKVEMYTEKH